MQESEEISIEDEDRLLRRVPYTDPKFIKDDGTPSSLAFSPKKEAMGLSVDIEKLTTYKKSIQNVRKFRLFAHEAREYRSLNLECEHDPLPSNYAHALILGINPKNRTIPRKLARSAIRVDYP